MFLPVMLAMLLNLAYNLVDSLWIGNLLGDEALAALTNATPMISLLYSFAAGLTSGMGILLAQVIGCKDREKEQRILSTSFVLTGVLCVIITILTEIFLGDILRLLNTPEETMKPALGYLSVYLLGNVAVFYFCYLTSMLRCYGSVSFQLIAMVVTGIMNAVLDPFMIMRFSFQGAAYATVISQLVSLVIMILYLMKKKYFRIDLRTVYVPLTWKMLATSLPAVLQQCIPSISTFVLTACISRFGVLALAGYGFPENWRCSSITPLW